jgi:hypothetical protein
MKLLTGENKSYTINKSKLEALELLGQQIQASHKVKEGISFFEGFEVLSIKTFHFDSRAVSIYRAILKVKEKGEKVMIESKINSYWYLEFTLFIIIITNILFSILTTFHYLVHPLFHSKEALHPSFWFFCSIWFLFTFLSLRRIHNFRLEGQKAIDALLKPLIT